MKSTWMTIVQTLFLFLLFHASQAFAAPTCSSLFAGRLNKNITYCIERTHPEIPLSPHEPVIYFFHGMNGSAHSWVDNGYSEALEILNREENFAPTTFVSFDTEGLSLFSDKGGQSEGPGAYESWLIKDFIPWIESQYSLCREKECRFLAGLSMGGLGALKTALRFSSLFSVVAVNSPALLPFNVYQGVSDWMAYFNRHPIGVMQGMGLLYAVKGVWTTSDQSNWNDPSWLAENFWDLKAFPKIYADVGGQDYFGFQEGFFRFKSVIEKRSLTGEFTFVPDGTHELFKERRWQLLRWLNARAQEHFSSLTLPTPDRSAKLD